MAIKIISASHHGFDGVLVTVEVDIMKGVPSFAIVGLPDASVREARERVRAAIVNSGYYFPLGRITINLAPADVKKVGTLLDLPIAIGILIISGQIKDIPLNDYVIFGELSLNGELKGVRGAISIIIEGNENNKRNFMFPLENLREVQNYITGNFYPFMNLKEVISFITNEDLLPYTGMHKEKAEKNKYLDFGEIIGQNSSKRAMEIVAAGRHNILLFGSPGAGKTMLAKALPSILPPMTEEEQMEVAKIYSISGLLDDGIGVNRPFRAPHHTITNKALIGGGKEIKAGEITLAHNGILFLDEFLEFKKETLELLRQPLEEGKIHISRLNDNYILPSKFMLIGAFNPCPCGKWLSGDESKCKCTEYEKRRYINRISSAILDRIDLLNFVPKIDFEEINSKKERLNSATMRERVMMANERECFRFKDTEYNYNSEIIGKDVLRLCNVTSGGQKVLESYYLKNDLSLRAYTKIIKVARTLADLEGQDKVSEGEIFEALGYRRNIFGEII